MQIFTYICLKGCHKIEVDKPHRCNENFSPLSFVEYPVYYPYALDIIRMDERIRPYLLVSTFILQVKIRIAKILNPPCNLHHDFQIHA